MAAVAFQTQTLASLLEVGDRVRTGPTPDDFLTVVSCAFRPTYVKFEMADFEHTVGVTRIPRTQVVTLLSFEVELEVADEDDEPSES